MLFWKQAEAIGSHLPLNLSNTERTVNVSSVFDAFPAPTNQTVQEVKDVKKYKRMLNLNVKFKIPTPPQI